jgi:hypothetical protein
MRVFKSTEFYTWLLVNVLSPIIIPFLIVLAMSIPMYIDKDLLGMIKMLWLGGAYIFLSLFVLFSLLPHFFDIAQPERKRSIVVVYTVTTVVVLFITCFLYVSYLLDKLMQSDNPVPYKPFSDNPVPYKPFIENLQLSLVVTIIGVIIAVFFKFYFLHEKISKNNHIPNDIPIFD